MKLSDLVLLIFRIDYGTSEITRCFLTLGNTQGLLKLLAELDKMDSSTLRSLWLIGQTGHYLLCLTNTGQAKPSLR